MWSDFRKAKIQETFITYDLLFYYVVSNKTW